MMRGFSTILSRLLQGLALLALGLQIVAAQVPSVCSRWETRQVQCNCHSCNCHTCYDDVCYSSVFSCTHGSCSTCWHPYFCCHRSSGTSCNCQQCCSTCNRRWDSSRSTLVSAHYLSSHPVSSHLLRYCAEHSLYAVHSIQGGRFLPATGGGQVVVNGGQFANLHGAIRCKFGHTASPEPGRYLSPSQISCTAPPHIRQGNVPVTISLDGGLHWTLENSTATVTFYQCPNDCSGKGTCEETEECLCAAGYRGQGCEKTCPGTERCGAPGLTAEFFDFEQSGEMPDLAGRTPDVITKVGQLNFGTTGHPFRIGLDYRFRDHFAS